MPQKAALKRPHSRRFARFASCVAVAKRLECARLTAAFGRTLRVERFICRGRIKAARTVTHQHASRSAMAVENAQRLGVLQPSGALGGRCQAADARLKSVSYTHLTLPTIYSV